MLCKFIPFEQLKIMRCYPVGAGASPCNILQHQLFSFSRKHICSIPKGLSPFLDNGLPGWNVCCWCGALRVTARKSLKCRNDQQNRYNYPLFEQRLPLFSANLLHETRSTFCQCVCYFFTIFISIHLYSLPPATLPHISISWCLLSGYLQTSRTSILPFDGSSHVPFSDRVCVAVSY